MSDEQTHAWLHKLLAETVKRAASDLFLKTDAPPGLRIDGDVNFLRGDPVPAAVMDQVAGAVLGEETSQLLVGELGAVPLAPIPVRHRHPLAGSR